MAQYDGSIRIGTGIDTSGIKKDSKQLEKELKNLADAQKSFLEAGGSKTSPVYKDYEKSIKSAQLALEYLKKTLDEQIEPPKDEHWNQLKIDVEEYAKSLKELQDQGKFFGDADYDKVYIAWKNATDAVKAYQAELNKQTESGQAKIAEQEVKAAERKETAQRRAEEQAERALQKENARIQKETEAEAKLQAAETERQAKIEAEAAEEERLARIRENAVVGNQRIIETVERIKQLEQEIADLKAVEKTEGYVDYDSRIQELSALKQEVKDYNDSIGRVKESYKKLGDIAKKALDSVGNMLKKANATINSFGKRIKEAFSKFTKSASDATKSANGFSLSLKNILKYGFGIRSLYALINKIRSAIKEGFTNLYNDRDMEFFRNSIYNLKSSALTLKNAFAAAFSPFVEIALPYVQKLLDYMTQLLNIAGQFFAAITGRKTYIKAIKQTTDALKEETKEMNRQLSPLDKLNNLSSQKETGTDTGAAGTMFEEVPIANSILDMAEKIKDILSKLFAPLKEAWEREGKFVMDSWKYALDEVWKLIKDIGRDFLTVWNQEATIKIFEDLLHIIGDIGLVVGHLARNFREAWNESQTGLHILENIRDIVGVIIHNIRLAADQTVEWADKLNFKPLLESFERFTKSLIPLADVLSGVLTDFYTHVLLPLAKWTIEKGLPELLDVFTAFNEKVDWQALRDNLAEFWDHLEPFAETIGEGLIIFIERVSDALADFLNSQEFKDFLVTIENWMDSVSPEDVADTLEMIAKALISLKLALLGYEAIKGISSVLANITTFVSGLKAVGSAIVGWLPHIAVGVAIADVLKKIKDAMESRFDTSNWGVLDWISNILETSLNGWKQKFDGFKISLELWWQDTWMSDAVWRFGQWWNEKIAPWFTKQKWSELWQNVKSTATEYFKSIATGISVEIENVTNKIKSKLEAIRTNFVNVFNSIKTTVVNIFNSIKTSIGNILDGISSKINSLSRSLSNIGGGTFSKGTSRVPAGGPSLLPRTSTFSTYAVNPALVALQDAEIPRLATGAVIPANREFLAVLGDQKRGTNVEAPLETIKQAQKESLLEIMSELGLTGGGNNQEINLNLTVECEGYKLIQLIQKLNGEYFKQNGKYAFT